MKYLLSTIITLFLFISVNSQEPTQFDKILQEKHLKGEFNGTALVIKNGATVFSGAFGVADKDSTRKLTTQSVFRMGSVGKQFTAMAIMILEERGKINFCQDVKDVIPGFPYEGVTIHHLLTHTSGLPNYIKLMDETYRPGLEFWEKEKLITVQDTMINRLFKAKPPILFKPGKKWKYSNTGYVLLSRIVEEISGQSFRQFLKENVFEPLKMNNTIVYKYIPGDSSITDRAYGYWVGKDKIYQNDLHYLNGMYGDGGVFSNVEDMAKWHQALKTEKIISFQARNRAFKGFRKIKWFSQKKYGYGWFVTEKKGEAIVVEHSGGWIAFKAYIYRDLKNDHAIIILTNNSSKRKHIENVLKEFKKGLKKE